MKTKFGFVRTEETKLLSNGTIRIYGPLLDELKALRPGDMLQLTDQSGRKFVVLMHEDFVRAQLQPELLEALRDCTEHMEWSTREGQQAYKAARAAIAKAEGFHQPQEAQP